jgi:hypothetical protein
VQLLLAACAAAVPYGCAGCTVTACDWLMIATKNPTIDLLS